MTGPHVAAAAMTRPGRVAVLTAAVLVVLLTVLGLVLFLSGPPAPDETRLGKSVFLRDGVVFGGVGGYLAVVRPATRPAGCRDLSGSSTPWTRCRRAS